MWYGVSGFEVHAGVTILFEVGYNELPHHAFRRRRSQGAFRGLAPIEATGFLRASSRQGHLFAAAELVGGDLLCSDSFLLAPVLMAYVGFFAVGLGPVFWLVLSEICPLRRRGRSMSVGTVANWGANLLVAVSFLTLTQVVGKAATFWLYAAISIGAWLFTFFFVPETKRQDPRTDRGTLEGRQEIENVEERRRLERPFAQVAQQITARRTMLVR